MFSKVLSEDIDHVLSDRNIDWDNFREKTVLVTGATGLIGSLIIRVLQTANSRRKLNIRILANCRNDKKIEGDLRSKEVILINQDIRQQIIISEPINFIFHCAAVTRSASMIQEPVSVIQTSVLGTMHVLELAKQKQIESMVYLSSMEVYGQIVPVKPFVTEKDMGWLDIESVRSCYPESKRLCENLCNSYHRQYGTPVKSARLAQTFGAGTPKDDPRVFAQFARHAMNSTDIALHTDGKSRGNYCYLSDTARALLLLINKGECGQAYNVSNPAASMTIREMANMVAEDICHGKIKVVNDMLADAEKLGYAAASDNVLSSDKLNAIGWRPTFGLREMYERLLDDWNECP